MNNLNQILSRFPAEVRPLIEKLPKEIQDAIEEIRIQIQEPIRVRAKNREWLLEQTINKEQFDGILNNLLDYSLYAYEEEIAKGYITIEGGHRVGICGHAVMENGNVRLLNNISSLNIRRSREILGVAEKIYPSILSEPLGIHNSLIVSPPKCGKTTLLRDLIRLLSSRGFRVGVCDERSEIAGMYRGVPSYDLGPRTDVLDGCPKAEGMLMLVRSMAPDIVVTDEIGKAEDIDAIESAIYAGVNIITTIHGKDFKDLEASNLKTLIQKKVFSRILYLSNLPKTGTIREVQYV